MAKLDVMGLFIWRQPVEGPYTTFALSPKMQVWLPHGAP
jgi:hypothetical protein